MPIFEYECPECLKRQEVILSQTQVREGYTTQCMGLSNLGHAPQQMRRVISAPAPHRHGGMEGKVRTAEKVRKRNADYHKSKKGQTEHWHNVGMAHKRLGI